MQFCPAPDSATQFQACTEANGDISYKLGGTSCTFQPSNSAEHDACVAQLTGYCDSISGTGGTGGGGGAGGSVTCTTTFSGAFSATYSPCAVTVTYVPAGGLWTISTAGNALPGTPYSWTGMTFALPGQPATGTFDQTQTMGASDEVADQSSSDPPVWLAGYGDGTTYGSASVTITSLGAAVSVATGTLYQAPHGTWTGTLVDQNPDTAQPDLMQTITF